MHFLKQLSYFSKQNYKSSVQSIWHLLFMSGEPKKKHNKQMQMFDQCLQSYSYGLRRIARILKVWKNKSILLFKSNMAAHEVRPWVLFGAPCRKPHLRDVECIFDAPNPIQP